MLWSPDHKAAVLDMIEKANEIAVAVGSTSGGPILDALVRRAADVPVLVVTGCRDGTTRRDALDRLKLAIKRSSGDVRIIDDRLASRFHVKVYAGVLQDGGAVAFVGSPNLSGAAFGRNTEVLVRHDLTREGWVELKGRLMAAGPLLDDWDDMPVAGPAPRRPKRDRITLAKVMKMSWQEYLAALRFMEQWWEPRLGRTRPVFGGGHGWMDTLDELANVRVLPLAALEEPERKTLAGTLVRKEVGFFGGLKPAKVRNAFHEPSSPEWVQVADAIHEARSSVGRIGDPLTVGEAMEPVRDLVALKDVGLGVATRVLISVRPDVYVSVNNKSRERLAALVDAPLQGPRGLDGYEALLRLVRKAPWHREPCPADPGGAEVWRGRAALLDVFAYEYEGS